MSDYVNELMSQQFEMEFQVQVPFLQLARALILDRLLNSLSLSITVYKTGTMLSQPASQGSGSQTLLYLVISHGPLKHPGFHPQKTGHLFIHSLCGSNN